MKTEQLNYIKEQQERNIYILPTVSLRETINDSIIEELETIYNPPLEGLETEFKSSLNDVSLPNTFLEDTKLISVIRTYGCNALLIYMSLHSKMCKEGYRIAWGELQQDVVSAILCGTYKINIEMVSEIIEEFIKLHLLYVISDGKTNYLTSIYQIFMYERISAKRLRDRIYKRNSKVKNKSEKLQIKTALPVFKEKNVTENSFAEFGEFGEESLFDSSFD